MTPDVPWALAVRVAGQIAGTHPLFESYHRTALAEEMPGIVARAQDLVVAETGLFGTGMPRVEVVDRRAWVERNVAFFSAIIDPAREALVASSPKAALQRVAGPIVAAETGALLGVLAKRVLGQYELVLPADGAGDTIYIVGPNVLALERAHQFIPAEFRMWLALHECAHRLQFVGVPWLRDHFLDLVQRLVGSARPEPGRLRRVTDDLVKAAGAGEPLIGEAGLLGLFANEDQRSLLDEMQAMMSLLEGHGHVVMDRVGSRVLATQGRMSKLLKQRRNDPRMAAFFRLTGMEMKMRQYEAGEKFVLGVESYAGWSTLDAAWAGPENLPTLAEIDDPVGWARRVA